MDRTTDNSTYNPNQFSAPDPYVANSDEGPQTFSPSPKSIEEILASISGYNQTEIESENPVNSPLPTQVTESVSGASNENVVLNRVLPVKKPSLMPPSLASATELLEELTQPDYDVRHFRNAEEEPETLPSPEPIRGAFEVDQEYFDHQTIDASDDSSHGGESEGTKDNSAAGDQPQAEPASDNHFWVDAGDVISIDGKSGFGHIDLACFDVSDASFQGNQIVISCEEGPSFRIEYRNVTHAIFADGVEIELAAFDQDFER